VSVLVELADVHFGYPGVERRRGRPFTLAGVSFAVARGEILGVIGPNSAGKTTLIRLLTKVLEPARGEIRLDGRSLATLSRGQLAREVAVVPQELPPSLPFTVEQLVLLGRYPHAPRRFFETAADLAVAREAMTMTGVLHLARAPVEGLSGGERQRVVLARALAQEPRLLVLDEPTAHLDLRYQVEAVALLRRVNRERGTTVLLVSHDLNLAAEVSDRLLLLAEGRVARLGTPADVLDERTLAGVYGCAVRVDRSETGRPRVQLVFSADGDARGAAPVTREVGAPTSRD
jgi:iron complex transport system ATP-binding protein